MRTIHKKTVSPSISEICSDKELLRAATLLMFLQLSTLAGVQNLQNNSPHTQMDNQ